MVLTRTEIRVRILPPIRSESAKEFYKKYYPEAVEYYDIMKYTEEELKDSRLWYRDNINNLINDFLKKNKISKKQLHSIETKSDYYSGDKATIVYEVE